MSMMSKLLMQRAYSCTRNTGEWTWCTPLLQERCSLYAHPYRNVGASVQLYDSLNRFVHATALISEQVGAHLVNDSAANPVNCGAVMHSDLRPELRPRAEHQITM